MLQHDAPSPTLTGVVLKHDLLHCLALADPPDGRLNPFGPRFRPFGGGDPVDVLPLPGGREGGVVLRRLGTSLHRGGKIDGHLRPGLGDFDATLVEVDGLPDEVEQRPLRRHLGEARHPAAEHDAVADQAARVVQLPGFPEAPGDVRPRRRDAADVALVGEDRHAPLDDLLNLRRRGEEDPPQLRQDRAGDFGCAGEVVVDAGGFEASHGTDANMVAMPDRPTLDYEVDTPKPREPRWRRVTVALFLTLVTVPCLWAAVGGAMSLVAGDIYFGPAPSWVVIIIALGLTFFTVKHWRAVRE